MRRFDRTERYFFFSQLRVKEETRVVLLPLLARAVPFFQVFPRNKVQRGIKRGDPIGSPLPNLKIP